ncbi:hypothetical protein [Sphingobium limneticum]|uniref:Uncharacterized protein n=1 Tax=Sphingobium limneticum TaxID=1007511 RepID=A0A5J5I916_9SPHN|nr:hypothetical protein [Sphingobium limneticum]KAA9020701.1 hypothetical protein F4U96_03265 [Sphingobium limneticum]KAA9033027.1 hypothetical protein F4U95_03265 [Sphingobium limneticum]
MSNAARNGLGFVVMLGAPWLVWLSFAHLVRPVISGGVVALIAAALSVMAGMSGFWLLGLPFARLHEKYLLGLLSAYAVMVILAQPFIGLMAICSTGDCI